MNSYDAYRAAAERLLDAIACLRDVPAELRTSHWHVTRSHLHASYNAMLAAEEDAAKRYVLAKEAAA